MAFTDPSAAVVFGTNNADTFFLQSMNGLFSTIYGGLGNDIYFIDAFFDDATDTPQDVVIEALGGGLDTVRLNMFRDTATNVGNTNYTLADNVENLEADLFSYGGGTLTFNLTGNSIANKITVLDIYNNSRASIDGGAGNDTLIGGAFADTLTGGTGADSMVGGGGGDRYFVDNELDKVVESADVGFDRVFSTVSFTLGANIEILTLNGTSNINGTGNALGNGVYGNSGNNILSGGAGDDDLVGGGGNDTLNGGAGNDFLEGNDYGSTFIDKLDGGAGDDFYIIRDADDIVADTGVGGSDTVQARVQLNGDLGAGIENLELFYSAGAINGRGNALNNIIDGNGYNNSLFGLAGSDLLNGGFGDDVLDGGDGNDTLDGGANNDLMRGGLGNDTYIIDSTSDLAIETTAGAAGGVDTVFSTVNVSALSNNALSANIENLTLLGTAAFGGGNDANNIIIGNDANNSLFGKYGADSLSGGAGDDSLQGDDGADTLNGGTGVDTMTGGAGNDLFIVDDTADDVQEGSGVGSGTDRVESSATFTLSADVENLKLTGTANINGTGNGIANTITGNIGSNALNGGLGADTMTGGLGNDTYFVDMAGDKVIELAGQGNDTVISSLNTFSLAALTNVENLTLENVGGSTAFNGIGNALNNTINGNGNANTLSGGAGNDTLNGYGGADTLNGGDGNDFLDGGVGIDSMTGGLGNDTYYIDNAGDVIVENVGAGNDTLNFNVAGQAVSLTGTFASIENASLKYGSGTNITGNGFNNKLTGNSGANSIVGGLGDDTLDGSSAFFGVSGIDTLIGGAGNDVYFVDTDTDELQEFVGGGIDRVESSVSFELDTNVFTQQIENITLTGSGNIYADGNDLNNRMVGNDGNNTLYAYGGNDTLIGGAGNDSLRGYGGADSMVGGLGDDEYYVDVVGDKVVELAGQGTDGVYSAISFNLAINGANVEILTLQGTAINGTGNALNNLIQGNSSANVLDGGAGNDELLGNGGADTLLGGLGNDTLNGGGANDTLTGGAGNDVFVTNGSGIDTITDFVSGIDSLDLGGFGALSFAGAGGSLLASQFLLDTDGITGTLDTLGTADTRIVYDQTSGNLYFDSNGNLAGGQQQILDLSIIGSGPALNSGDIFS